VKLQLSLFSYLDSLLWNEDTGSNKHLSRMAWQQAACTKAAAGCRSPKGTSLPRTMAGTYFLLTFFF
jgi:hypothetical protein